MVTKPSTNTAPVERNSAGLRAALFDELDSLRNGTTNPNKANSVAKLADQVIATVKMELDVHRYMSKIPATDKAPTALPSPVVF